MKPTPYEYMKSIMQADDKTSAVTNPDPNRYADFMAREIDKIIPQPKESK